MKSMLVKLMLAGASAVMLTGCLGAGAPAPGERVIKYAYCTDMEGNVVNDPAEAVEKGTPLRCYNFINE